MKLSSLRILATVCLTACSSAVLSHPAEDQRERVKSVVDMMVQPVMKQYGIAGMAVGVIVAGRPYEFDYGVASIKTGKPVTHDTLFELGSLSKTLTVTLTSYAQESGQLKLSDTTSQYLPALQGTPFGDLSLLELGTHTTGGLPLQVPDDIKDEAQLIKYLQAWHPAYAPGSYRTYSNVSIGTLGLITAVSLHQPFDTLMEQRLFPALGMKSSYIKVPAAGMADYAQGYTRENAPIRMADAVLSEEAYGIRTTAADMLRFLEANLGLIELDPKLQRAIANTHTGYFKAGEMTQDLIWEQYAYPVDLKTLLAGNSSSLIFNATPVTRLAPPEQAREDVLLNKTGSTNGFGAYIAFVPQEKFGIVMLANKNFPINDRVTMAHQILTLLASRGKEH